MRTTLLAGLFLCTGACAHTQTQNSVLSSSSQNEPAASADSCLRDDDAIDQPPCPVQGAPQEQDVTRMTSLLQPRNEAVSTADATPAAPTEGTEAKPAPTSVAEDAP